MNELTFKELKRLINRYEYKYDSGVYEALLLSQNTTSNDNNKCLFHIDTDLGFRTFLICDRLLIDRQHKYIMLNVIFIDRDFKTHQFETFDDFIKFIPTLDFIVEIHKCK